MKESKNIHQTFFSITPFLAILLTMAAVSGIRAQVGPLATANRDSLIFAAREIMGLQTYCALITIDSTGCPRARTMNPFPPEEDMTVWMATSTRTLKIREIRMNPKVCLYFADHKQALGYVSITGKAVLVDDQKEIMKRKRAYWDQAFQDWKTLVLIKVIPERIEVLNYKRGFNNDPVTWKTPSIEF